MRSIFTLIFLLGVMTCLQANLYVSELRIYPNPSSSGNYVLEMNEVRTGAPIQIKVFNIIGQEVFIQQVEASMSTVRTVINLAHLPKGSYILEVTQGEDKKIQKLSFI